MKTISKGQFHPYRLEFEEDKEDGGFVVTSPDVPELLTQGDTKEEAIENARDALLAALLGYIKQRKAFPMPSKAPKAGENSIRLPELVQAKVILYNALVEEGLPNTELAHLIGKKENQVRRMIDPYTSVRFQDLAEALRAMHFRLFMGVEKVA